MGPSKAAKPIERSPALSMAGTVKSTIKTRKTAVLIADGFDATALTMMKGALAAKGAQVKMVASRLGAIVGMGGATVQADFSLLTAASVLFDAVYVPGGRASAEMLADGADAIHFITRPTNTVRPSRPPAKVWTCFAPQRWDPLSTATGIQAW